ncbi:MAG TPA: phenylacetate--CoA ligase family protein [Aliidongia sp.]|uniref:phenylacetate--CoA ligase family protein n=1 Tax=Aliidongia sp. TaxID=1914230 RepID=UPI002DDCDABC|nr:phenylacetate--CoA ligase family protein [Aliidongia sp.]HEV2678283.1 phenylacetate--CoA ligase family protein [Aliidongia sp.]
MTDYYDALETRPPEVREAALLAALPGQVAHAQSRAPGFARLLDGIDPATITSRAALAALPVTRKSDLIEAQKAVRPFAGLNATAPGRLARIFQSPGPIYDPEGRGPDWWRFARALHAAGFRPGEIIHNAFSYHMTPAGSMFETGAQALGCAVFPAGVGQTEQQVRAIADIGPAGYVGTPSFLTLILDKAAEIGVPVPSLTKGLVSGEAYPEAARARFAEAGMAVLQCYASADLGLIAYETRPRGGLIIDEGVLVELLRPGTGDPVGPDEVGEVVVTSFNADYPLIRFATGDLSQFLDGDSPCGRTNRRLKGWLGRADQTTKVKGMFVHPSQVAEIVRRHAGIARARLVVEHDGQGDRMTLLCEPVDRAGDMAAIQETIQAVTKLRGTVRFVALGTLANDGKVIDDQRS